MDTFSLKLEVKLQKFNEVYHEFLGWQGKGKNKLREVQHLVGLLNFCTTCIHEGKIFLSRIPNFLKTMNPTSSVVIPGSVRIYINHGLHSCITTIEIHHEK